MVRPGQGARRGRDRRWDLGWIAWIALLAVPALVVDVAPLSDWPDHLARVHVLTRGATWFVPAWDPLPNLAVDLAGRALAPVLGLERSGRWLVVAAIAVWALGCRSLGRAVVGRDGVRALVAAALVWSEPLLLGYVGFTLGAGLALLALAAVVRGLGGAGRGAWVAAGALGLATAVSHAAAAAILVAAVGGLVAGEVARRRTWSREATLAAAAMGPALLYVGQWWARRASDDGASFATPGMIARALIAPVTGLDTLLDLASLGLLALLGLAAAWRARPLAVRVGPALAACVCLALVALFPADVAGGIEVHGRFALPGWVLAMMAIDRRDTPTAPRLDAIAAAAVLLLGARTAHLAGELRVIDAEARAIRALLAEHLPPRASLAVVWFFPGERMPTADRVRALATLHVPALAIVDRDAHVPMLYALPGVQPLRYLGTLPRAHRFLPSEAGPDPAQLAARFDFVWLCGGPERIERELRLHGARLGEVGRCALIATRRDDVARIAPAGEPGQRTTSRQQPLTQ